MADKSSHRELLRQFHEVWWDPPQYDWDKVDMSQFTESQLKEMATNHARTVMEILDVYIDDDNFNTNLVLDARMVMAALLETANQLETGEHKEG